MIAYAVRHVSSLFSKITSLNVSATKRFFSQIDLTVNGKFNKALKNRYLSRNMHSCGVGASISKSQSCVLSLFFI